MQKLTALSKKILSIIVGVIIFYFLGYHIWVNWQEVYPLLVDFNIAWGIGSVLLAMLTYAFNVLIWDISLNKVMAVNLPYNTGLRIWSISQMGRYVPGKIWAVLGRIHLCEKENIPKITTAVSMCFELILVVVAALLLFLVGIPFWPTALPLLNIKWVFVLLPILLACLHPLILKKILNLVLRHNDQGVTKINIGFDALFQLMGLALFNFLIIGAALFCIVRTVYVVDIVNIPFLGGIFGVSWLLGMFALFAPSGIGVREGVLAYLLSFHLPVYIGSIVAILSRLLFMIAEILFFVISLIITRNKG